MILRGSKGAREHHSTMVLRGSKGKGGEGNPYYVGGC